MSQEHEEYEIALHTMPASHTHIHTPQARKGSSMARTLKFTCLPDIGVAFPAKQKMKTE